MPSSRNWPRKKADLGILIKPARDPLYGYTRGELRKKLKDALRGRIAEAWIFGSFASGIMHAYSDIDLILVEETVKPFTERVMDFQDLLDIHPCMDILVYTPDEFEQITRDPSPGFWKTVTDTMVRLL